MRMSAGMALMKPTSFLFEDTRTPQCHWGSQPGGRRALGGQERFSSGAERLKPPRTLDGRKTGAREDTTPGELTI